MTNLAYSGTMIDLPMTHYSRYLFIHTHIKVGTVFLYMIVDILYIVVIFFSALNPIMDVLFPQLYNKQ